MKKTKITIADLLLALLFIFFVAVFLVCEGQEDPSVTAVPMEEREQVALYSAIQGFVGRWWNGSDLFPDPCGWTPIEGVSCELYDGFWFVTVMNIGPVYDNSLQCTENAKFTHHLFKLAHLKSLSFFNCFLSLTQNPIGIPSSNWEKLAASLESLEFRSNPGLIGTVPATIACLEKLQSVVLLENGLTGQLPMELGNLVSLKRLVLAGNHFTGWIPESLGRLIQLLILDLSRNNLSGPMPLTFGGLTSLLKLDLSNNALEGQLPEELGSLKNVTLLDLGNNNFSGGLIKSLEEMVSLKEMIISNNQIAGDLLGLQWENLQNLEVLDLSKMDLVGKIPISISKMKRLRFLGLNDNNLTGSLPPGLAVPGISALYLNGNNLTGKLEFSGGFYRKMGSRFGAWNNPNLCYQAELTSASHVPYGVRPCEPETTIIHADHTNTKIRKGDLKQNTHFGASSGSSSCGVHGFRGSFVLCWSLLLFRMWVL